MSLYVPRAPEMVVLEEPLYHGLKPTYVSGVPAPVPSPEDVLRTPVTVDPRMDFHDKFQREMEEHGRDFEKKYDGDLDTTLIFSGLFSAVTSAFIIDVQSELTPDYEQMNNTLLEMLLNATTGSLPAGTVTSVPRWSGPDPVIVQVQCILYAALSAALLASFLAMIGKQWLNRYGQSETHGSIADRSRVRERKLNGIETWKFHLIMESLPLILQCALLLLGFALSRYLWGVNRSVSSVVIGFASFGLLFYLSIVMASIFSFDCPFQTPLSLVIRSIIRLAVPYWLNVRRVFGPKQRPPQPGTPGTQQDLPFSVDIIDRGEKFKASTTAIPCIAPDPTQFPGPVAPLFIQKAEAEGDRLDARCITRMFVMSTDPNVVTSTMGFIPEIIWHSGIKNVPLRRTYGTLIDCFNFSGPSPVVIPGMRNIAYLSARAFAHIALQRRCITQYEEHKQDSWKALCASHPILSPMDYGRDSDLEAALFMVDTTLGYDTAFPWKQAEMTPSNRAWMSHVFLYHVWHEEQLSETVMDFVENSISEGHVDRPPNDIVITDCLFIIGLMIGVPFHVNDITVKDKSRKKKSILRKIFRALSITFASESIQTPLPLPALRLITRLTISDISIPSYELFKTIMTSDSLTDQHWEAARLAARGAFQKNAQAPELGEPKEILKFLDYHLGLQEVKGDYRSSISCALRAILAGSGAHQVGRHLTVECIRKFDCANPSFVMGVRSIMHPNNPRRLRQKAAGLVALISDQWFNSPAPIMGPEEMSEFCRHLAAFAVDDGFNQTTSRRSSITILFGMLRSPDWRKHIVTRLWSVFANCDLAEEEQESFRWCLQNAIEILEFMRGLPDGEGLKWWYVTLWFHYDKLDAVVRDEAERIARDMSRSDGVSDLNLYLNLIEREVAKIREPKSHPWEGISEASNGSDSPRIFYAPGGFDVPGGSGVLGGSDVLGGFDVSSGSDVSSESDVELSESGVDPVEATNPR